MTKSVGWSGRFGSPAWSPDGKWLAFSFRNPGVGAVPDIFVMETAGNKVEQLTHHPGNDAAPSWSPDAEKIAFLSSRDGNAEIYVMNRDGGQKRNLTNHPASDARPAWSPDGQKIAFYSDRENSQDDIYVMNADGTNVVNLTRHPAEDRLPAWSPDGKWIAFRSARARDWGWEIYVIDANGGNQTQVTKTLFAHNGSPSWVIGEPPVRGNPQAVNPLDKLPTFWGRLKSETR